MKLLVVFLLVGSMLVLSEGFPEPEPGPEAEPTEEREADTESADEESADGDAEHSVVKRARRCPCGWRRFGTRCLVVKGPLKWVDAQRRCQSMGGNLLSVHNAQQINQALSLLGKRRTWIAASDAQEEGQWLNVDGTPFNYANWCSGEPNNAGGREHCVEINNTGTGGRNTYGRKCWNDVSCRSRLHSICTRRVNS
ncbi:galactose-specific lectin nattectin-like isoform X1 [Sphaeramia orbicularis]|uniref:galactose-specific lectin nattectin-like isoform X1 n=1 Tax=Sphaeramia orbicularis TaxID=375764 RepID=UPI00117E5EE6|nr:galactose-specific lectin nattectin-like isoform X1 [Sphaeramia orbicularis]